MVDYQSEHVITESGDRVGLTNIVTHPAGPTLGVAARNAPFGIERSG